jgi:hypothetical protein
VFSGSFTKTNTHLVSASKWLGSSVCKSMSGFYNKDMRCLVIEHQLITREAFHVELVIIPTEPLRPIPALQWISTFRPSATCASTHSTASLSTESSSGCCIRTTQQFMKNSRNFRRVFSTWVEAIHTCAPSTVPNLR